MLKKIKKPWGYEEIISHTENYAMKRICIHSGHRMSLQYHKKKEETVCVISEQPLTVWLSENDAEFFKLEKGGIFHVKPGTIHRFGSSSDGDCTIIECSTPELEDVTRLLDDYNR
jgi:mannose-6-phosphate isomerase-like protein (cupin superfamily)